MKVPLIKLEFTVQELEALQAPIKRGWVVQGPEVEKFESLVCEFTGAQYAIATSSCTTALHLSLLAIGIGPGDEVLVPSFTFIASVNAIEHCGATPVFCDIDLKTFNIEIQGLENKISSRCKAVMPVHLFGLPAEMDLITEFSKKNNLAIIEDAACALGGFYKGKHVGAIGDAGCISFHPRKIITTGEGGMIITNDEKLMECCRSMRNHGASKSDLIRHHKKDFLLPNYPLPGYNYRMTDFQAALGAAQMNRLETLLERRIKRAERYRKLLNNVEGIILPEIPSYCQHGYQSFVLLLSDNKDSGFVAKDAERLGEKRNKIISFLQEKGIECRQGTHAVHCQRYYQKKYGLRKEDFSNSYLAQEATLALPLYPQMSDEEQDYVIQELIKALEILF
jgi:dTDP-4-amino-4,6-dideoxygalactose transaminase